jgi:hypothetical protein
LVLLTFCHRWKAEVLEKEVPNIVKATAQFRVLFWRDDIMRTFLLALEGMCLHPDFYEAVSDNLYQILTTLSELARSRTQHTVLDPVACV